MAFGDPLFAVEITWTETSGKSVTREWQADPAVITSMDELITEWELRQAEVIGLSDSVVSKIAYKQYLLEESLTLPAAAENSNQALLSAKLAGKPNKSGTLSIPAAKATLFAAATGKNYDVVDVTDTLVSHFLDMFAPTGAWVFSDGDHLVKATASGKRRNVKTTGS